MNLKNLLKKTPIQVAIITGIFLILIAFIPIFFNPNKSDSKESYTVSSTDQKGGITAGKLEVYKGNTEEIPSSGKLNQNVFTWAVSPKVIVEDGVPREQTSSDGTINWAGTTTTILNIWPNSDIYGEY